MEVGNTQTGRFPEVQEQTDQLTFEEVEECAYLGPLTNKKCEEHKEIETRKPRGNKREGALNYLIRSKHLSPKSKFRIYKTLDPICNEGKSI